jgi:nucleotide-binding universal stress UspA family protein
MYKKILVPLDGSELSESVLEHVINIVKGCKVPQVVLTRVRYPLDKGVEDTLDAKIAAELDEVYQEEAGSYLTKVAADLKEKGIIAESVVLSGNPAEEILNYTQKSGVDMIIMSTHGRSGVSRLFFGSVADKIVRHSLVPVLIKPAGPRTS